MAPQTKSHALNSGSIIERVPERFVAGVEIERLAIAVSEAGALRPEFLNLLDCGARRGFDGPAYRRKVSGGAIGASVPAFRPVAREVHCAAWRFPRRLRRIWIRLAMQYRTRAIPRRNARRYRRRPAPRRAPHQGRPDSHHNIRRRRARIRIAQARYTPARQTRRRR